MIEAKFTEEQMREFGLEVVPVVEKLMEITRKHGIDGGISLWSTDDYISIEGSGFDGWELRKCCGEYSAVYNKRVAIDRKQEEADAE